MLYLEIEQYPYFAIVRILYALLPFRFLSLILVFKNLAIISLTEGLINSSLNQLA